jgi:hypothetical protein
MLAAHLEELAVRFLVDEFLIEEFPQVLELHEIGGVVAEFLVRPVHGIALVLRPVARVLDRERGGEHDHLGEAIELARGEQHPPDARVDRKARELLADGGELTISIYRPELEQVAIPVLDLAWRRRIEEGIVGHLAQLQRRHAQDHGRERGAQDLRRGERRPRLEILLGVEADRDAARDAPAAPRPLARRGLRDRLDPQLVDLLPRRVALDAREARVDHVVDPRDRERRFRYVGRREPRAGPAPA